MPNPPLSAGDIAPATFDYADSGDIGDAPPFNYRDAGALGGASFLTMAPMGLSVGGKGAAQGKYGNAYDPLTGSKPQPQQGTQVWAPATPSRRIDYTREVHGRNPYWDDLGLGFSVIGVPRGTVVRVNGRELAPYRSQRPGDRTEFLSRPRNTAEWTTQYGTNRDGSAAPTLVYTAKVSPGPNMATLDPPGGPTRSVLWTAGPNYEGPTVLFESLSGGDAPAGMVWGNAGPDFVSAPPFDYGVYGPSGDIAPVRFASAGAVPTSGNPATSYPPGTYDFVAQVLVRGAVPVINRSAADTRFRQVLNDRDIFAGTVTADGPVAFVQGALLTENFSKITQSPEGPVIRTLAQPATWITVSGKVTSRSGFQTSTFEHAIARTLGTQGVAQWRVVAPTGTVQTSFGAGYRGGAVDMIAERATAQALLPRFAVSIPQDGAALQNVFSLPDACTGGSLFTEGSPFYRACVRFAPASPTQAAPPPAPQVTPTAPPAPAPQTGCAVVIRDYTFLRPVATFTQTGPRIPAGSTLYLLARTNLSQRASTGNTVTVYRARTIDGQTGFVVLDPQDVANSNPPQCVAALPVDSSVTLNTAAPPPSPPPAQPVRPAPQLPPTANQPIPGTVSQTPTSGLSTGSMFGIAAAAAAVGVGVAVATKNPKRSLGKAKGAKGEVTARGSKTTKRR